MCNLRSPADLHQVKKEQFAVIIELTDILFAIRSQTGAHDYAINIYSKENFQSGKNIMMKK